MVNFDDIDALCKQAGFTSYEKYLRSDHWKNLKRAAAIHTRSCCVCGGRGELGHHIRYRNIMDVQPDDLAPMCHKCHEDFHIACRWGNTDYIGLDIPRIIEITNTLRESPKYVHRQRKLIARAGKRKIRKQKANNYGSNSFKREAKRKFRATLKGHLTVEKVAQFCDWMRSSFKAQPPQTNHPVNQQLMDETNAPF